MTTRSVRSDGLAAVVVLLVVSVMSVALLGAWLQKTAARPKPAQAASSQGAKVSFDGGRAYDYLRRVVAFGPRPAGSRALAQTREYIKSELKALGIEAVEQPFDADTPLGRFRMANIIARIPGASPQRIVFAGHYDTKLFREFQFVGANDAGSSTAFLLEWARVLKARPNRFTSELLFLDGEEAMRTEWQDPDNRYGSRHYVRAAEQDGSLKQLRAMILVDMVGGRDLQIKREGYSTDWLTDLIWSAAKRLKLGSVFVDQETPIDDDHVPFLHAGVPAVDLIELDTYRYWHTQDDTLDKVSARSMEIVGRVLAEALPDIEKRLGAGRGR